MIDDGFDDALNAFDEERKKLNDAIQAGAWEIALQVQGAAQQNLRKSVVTGNLRGSAYTRAAGKVERLDSSKMNPALNQAIPSDTHGPIWAETGFTANYALYAHENMEGRAPKYLEEAVNKNIRKVGEIMRRRVNNR